MASHFRRFLVGSSLFVFRSYFREFIDDASQISQPAKGFLMGNSLWGALQQVSLFQDLAASQKERLAIGSRLLHFEAGTRVLQTHTPTPALFWVFEGTLKVFLIQEDGSDSLLNIVGRGEVLGEVNFMDGAGHSAEVETLEAAELLRVERQTLLEICQAAPILQRRLEGLMAQRIRFLSERQSWMARAGTGERVGRLLLFFAARYPNPDGGSIALPLRLSQHDLAALIGASRYRVHLCLHELESAGLVRREPRHRITICDPAALNQWCRQCAAKMSPL